MSSHAPPTPLSNGSPEQQKAVKNGGPGSWGMSIGGPREVMDFFTRFIVILCFLLSHSRGFSYENEILDTLLGDFIDFPIDDDEFEYHPRPRRQSEDPDCKKGIGHELKVSAMNNYSGVPFFLGNFTESPLFRRFPAQQPQSCPPPTGSWWPGDEPHTRTICPFFYRVTDLGEIYYPRYAFTVQCLCTECINNRRGRCVFKRRRVNMLRRTGCNGKKPVYLNQTKSLIVECVCEEWNMNTIAFGPLPTE
ncbi:hypothetical protein Btru_059421 [Bulinus truncatus]|nr:hypothetical protein Btru_059421 [Bulinus truncatus]